jgi:hypothetical protein
MKLLIIRDLNSHQLYGSGLAAILICLLGYVFSGIDTWVYVAIGAVLLLMIWPEPFRYFGMAWFGLGELLGFFVSRVLLTIIYGLLVIPIGMLVRKRLRRNMQLSLFKTGEGSAFTSRNHLFTEKDFEKPF